MCELTMRCDDCGHWSDRIDEMSEPPVRRGDAIERTIRCGACGGRTVRFVRRPE